MKFADRVDAGRDFGPTSDDEVVRVLEQAETSAVEAVDVLVGRERLGGTLAVPPGAPGIVVFAHGSGSSRWSPRNRYVASVLQRAGFGTLLLDLLTPAEERDRSKVFDIYLLAGRLREATSWVWSDIDAHLPVGYLGASTGAAAALRAAAAVGERVAAVVSLGGRPELAAGSLLAVRSPTLLIVGELDIHVLALNGHAFELMRCTRRLAVVPGATNVFEEPGTLETAADLARDWFVDHLGQSRSSVDARPGALAVRAWNEGAVAADVPA